MKEKVIMESVASLTQSAVSDVHTLARRFEPVLRYTQGELFFPMPVVLPARRNPTW
jgi:hypothetical protein